MFFGSLCFVVVCFCFGLICMMGYFFCIFFEEEGGVLVNPTQLRSFLLIFHFLGGCFCVFSTIWGGECSLGA